MALLIPRWGPIGRFLNPGPFNRKEHAAIVIMASAASVSAESTLVIAAQRMFYNGYPNKAAAIFTTMSSQLLGYGLAGMMRGTLLWPVKMLYPANLPITTILETLHSDKSGNQQRLRVFWIVFAGLFLWTIIPEYLFPLLIGFSIFCLAKQDSLVFTNLFGGSNGNEGTGFLSLCLDWNYIAGFGSPLWLPLQTLTNSLIGSM
jgi:OPT oligopeptide transporter protein